MYLPSFFFRFTTVPAVILPAAQSHSSCPRVIRFPQSFQLFKSEERLIDMAIAETWNNAVFILVSIKKMLIGLISVENLSGPITIAQVAGQTATFGLEYYLSFLAVLSISLGILNLLPVPVLDGGHLLYYLIEAVIRRPVPEKIQAMGMQLGIFLIVSIMFIAFYNDINRLL